MIKQTGSSPQTDFKMLKNYFIIGWRNLLRNKGFSSINLFGLSLGMTCTILILLWVRDELSYNKSNENYDRIYQVMAHRDFNNQIFTDPNMVLPLAPAIEKEIPQVENAVVSTHYQDVNLRYGDQPFRISGITTSQNFFEVFTMDFIKRSHPNPLSDPSSIVLTKSTAATIFGDEDPLDKVLSLGPERQVKVAGIIADLPPNSTIQFDCIRSFDYSSDYVKENMEEWSSSSWVVVIETLPGADMKLVDKQINEIKFRNNPPDREISTYFSFPMAKWRLYSDFNEGVNTGGMIEYVRLFSIIAIIILVIACVNFMNLSTARSEKRAREVGIRKTLGSLRKQLVIQFFTESTILAFLSFGISLITVFLLLPSFNQLVDKQLSVQLSQPVFWLGALAIIIFTGILAGSYPALFLSSFNPVKVLKGAFVSGKRTVLPRQALIVFQFTISILLITATIVVYQQISMIRDRDIGYDPNNLISIPGSAETQNNFNVIKQELLQTGLIHSVTRTLSPMTDIWWRNRAPDWEGKPEGVHMIVTGLTTDADFTRTMGIKLLAGKDFTGTPADSSHVLLNKAAVEEMNLDNPVGMKLNYGDQDEYTILGVTDNVVQESPFKPVEPMLIFFNPGRSNYLSLRLNNQIQPQEALVAVEEIFKKYNPSQVFEYQFVDQEFEAKFIREQLISKLSNIFAVLAVTICCIGLAGLAAFTIEKRSLEISLRKILGASLHQILGLISKEFLKLVCLALIIAVPLSWWFMNRWLENYQYRVEISIWVFVVVGLSTLVLALGVVSANTIKAALGNPMKSLRSE